MPRDGDFKRHVRRRMRETGERYTRARELLRSPEPIEWGLTGGARDAYAVSTDTDARRAGGRVDVLSCVGDPGPGFGALVSRIDAMPYRGQRVRLSGRVRTEAVEPGWAGLWMRVDAAGGTLAFDNMQRRPIRGTSGWRDVEVVLEVAPEAEAIVFGLILAGHGTARITGARLEAAPADTVTTGQQYIDGWGLAGNRPDAYEMRSDPERPDALVLRSVGDPGGGFGTVMKSVPAAPYCGRRARIRASVRGEGVDGWGGLWMRVDDARQQSLVFDNMQDRPLRGTFDWTPIEVVLDVSADARVIAHGVLMAGRGEIAMGDVNLETVDDSVPTTGRRLAPGWMLSGSAPTAYEIQLAQNGKAARLHSVSHPGEEGYGTLTRQVPADAPGRRVRFRASLRADGAGAQVVLWMRADDDQQQLVIVNHPEPPLEAPFEWREEAVELTIPEPATVLSFGVVLAGQGSVDIKDAELELAD